MEETPKNIKKQVKRSLSERSPDILTQVEIVKRVKEENGFKIKHSVEPIPEMAELEEELAEEVAIQQDPEQFDPNDPNILAKIFAKLTKLDKLDAIDKNIRS